MERDNKRVMVLFRTTRAACAGTCLHRTVRALPRSVHVPRWYLVGFWFFIWIFFFS